MWHSTNMCRHLPRVCKCHATTSTCFVPHQPRPPQVHAQAPGTASMGQPGPAGPHRSGTEPRRACDSVGVRHLGRRTHGGAKKVSGNHGRGWSCTTAHVGPPQPGPASLPPGAPSMAPHGQPCHKTVLRRCAGPGRPMGSATGSAWTTVYGAATAPTTRPMTRNFSISSRPL